MASSNKATATGVNWSTWIARKTPCWCWHQHPAEVEHIPHDLQHKPPRMVEIHLLWPHSTTTPCREKKKKRTGIKLGKEEEEISTTTTKNAALEEIFMPQESYGILWMFEVGGSGSEPEGAYYCWCHGRKFFGVFPCRKPTTIMSSTTTTSLEHSKLCATLATESGLIGSDNSSCRSISCPSSAAILKRCVWWMLGKAYCTRIT